MPIAAHLRSSAKRLAKILAAKDHDKQLLIGGEYEPTASAREKQAAQITKGNH